MENQIVPTLATDHKRKEVIKYVQRLIRKRVGCEVFPYGSVPLKTYLPDGDIDLTTLSCPSVEDAWVSDVHAVLREEEHNEASRFEVKDIHCIDAEVKRVKCQSQETHTQQLQENPLSFNHNRFGHIAKHQFSNSSKTIKLYTQQENPLIKKIKKKKKYNFHTQHHSFSIKIQKKKGRIQR
ncbi:uncharacterized protein LOC126724842 [Quercus robur]|uniref:uncharacterized protein LOC126724842 n=1 Tax=Quercus robur TaxID=38942 RepID=UPI0021619226|nr:uncharacterized protein LOC126724842 [Quercus robur]XP_050285216.1 uncharacterized protein LOC126724842 [Quercus robur]XP_050285224.1 uncharacterized protein LOC126724842 [Quercus robur]